MSVIDDKIEIVKYKCNTADSLIEELYRTKKNPNIPKDQKEDAIKMHIGSLKTSSFHLQEMIIDPIVPERERYRLISYRRKLEEEIIETEKELGISYVIPNSYGRGFDVKP